MKWSMEELQQRFHEQQGIIENELRSMRNHKTPEDSSYQKFHDFDLGALLVYISLETTAELASRQRLLVRLREMLKEDVPESIAAFSIDDVHKGWSSEVKKLLAEFSYHYVSERRTK